MSASFLINYAELEAAETYGGKWSADYKRKSLLKFGGNGDVDTTTSTLWNGTGNEVYATTDAITTVSSSSASDAGQMTVEGHTVEGTGTDARFTFVVQDVTLDGQTEVSLATPLARVSRMYNPTGTEWVGDIYAYESDTVTAGVPQTDAKIHAKINAGDQQTRKAATTISNDDMFFISSMLVGINKKKVETADCELQVRKVGGVFLPKARLTVSSTGTSTFSERFEPYIIAPSNSDVRIVAAAGSSGVEVSAHISGWLALRRA